MRLVKLKQGKYVQLILLSIEVIRTFKPTVKLYNKFSQGEKIDISIHDTPGDPKLIELFNSDDIYGKVNKFIHTKTQHLVRLKYSGGIQYLFLKHDELGQLTNAIAENDYLFLRMNGYYHERANFIKIIDDLELKRNIAMIGVEHVSSQDIYKSSMEMSPSFIIKKIDTIYGSDSEFATSHAVTGITRFLRYMVKECDRLIFKMLRNEEDTEERPMNFLYEFTREKFDGSEYSNALGLNEMSIRNLSSILIALKKSGHNFSLATIVKDLIRVPIFIQRIHRYMVKSSSAFIRRYYPLDDCLKEYFRNTYYHELTYKGVCTFKLKEIPFKLKDVNTFYGRSGDLYTIGLKRLYKSLKIQTDTDVIGSRLKEVSGNVFNSKVYDFCASSSVKDKVYICGSVMPLCVLDKCWEDYKSAFVNEKGLMKDIDIAVYDDNFEDFVESVLINKLIRPELCFTFKKITKPSGYFKYEIKFSNGLILDVFEPVLTVNELVSKFHVPAVRLYHAIHEIYVFPSFIQTALTGTFNNVRLAKGGISMDQLRRKYMLRGFKFSGTLEEIKRMRKCVEEKVHIISVAEGIESDNECIPNPIVNHPLTNKLRKKIKETANIDVHPLETLYVEPVIEHAIPPLETVDDEDMELDPMTFEELDVN